MNDVCGREASHKYIVFSVVFSMLRFVLGAPGPSTEEVSLREIIRKYNTSKDAKTLNLHFSSDNILELESCLKAKSQELSGKIKKHLSKFKKVIIEIDDFVETRDGGRKDLFKKIVELFRPAGLSILSGSLIDEDIEGIVLNENMEMFRLNGSNITNMDRLFRKEKNTVLVEVNISNNGLESFPIGLLCAPVLKKLDISRNINVFSTWNDLMGKEYKKYRPEDDCNNINEIDEEKLSGFFEILFPKLTDLNVSDTGLSPTVPMPLSKLERLDISHNTDLFEDKSEEDISQFFSQFPDLKDLNMRNTGLSQAVPIPLSKLEKLDISGNSGLFEGKDKRVISRFLSKFQNLTDLNMRNTGLSHAVLMPSLSKLKKLDISANFDLFKGKDKRFISKFFSQFENVKDLTMWSTGLSQTVPIKLYKLEKLNISWNPDLFEGKDEGVISRFLSHFKNVKDLDISFNKLSGTILIPLKNLKRLDASNNSELTEIKHTEDNPKLFMNLEELDICGCEKLDIDNVFLKRLESLKYLGAIDVLLKGNDKCESLLQKSFRKITYGQYLDMKERGYNLDSSILKNNYSEIYSLGRLRVLCIGEDKISYPELFSSKGVKITYFQYSYKESVEEDRRKNG